MLTELSLLGGFMLMWLGISRFCFNYFECPEALKPQNNQGKRTKTYFDFYGNYVSICHALISITICLYILSVEGISFGKPNTFLTNIGVANTLAYFLYDTIVSEYYGYNNLAMTLHHIGSILGVGIIFCLQSCGSEAVVAIILAEISNPFNLYRDVMKHQGRAGTKEYIKISLVFAVSFVFCRFIVFPFYLVKLYASDTHILVKLPAAFVWFVSWHWLFIIFNLAFKELKVFNELEEAKQKYNIWQAPYNLFMRLRKSKLFMGSFYLSAAYCSFGTLYVKHFGTVSV